MSCRSAANIKIEPMKVWFAQVPTFCVDVEAETGTNLGGKYFTFSHPNGTKYQVWYDKDNLSTPPAILPSHTLVEVEINAGDSAAEVATALIAELNSLTAVIALADPKNAGRVIVKSLGYVTVSAPTVGTLTGHVLESVSAGFFHDFGYTDGDLELATEQQIQDITAHQAGVEPITSIINGLTAEVAVALKEISAENLERLIELTSGGSHTPGGGDKLIGFGSGQNFSNVLDRAGRLIMHPVRLVDSDNSQDWCLWLAYPKLDSLVFSGENPELINVTFSAYRDEFIDSEIDKLSYGDHTQL